MWKERRKDNKRRQEKRRNTQPNKAKKKYERNENYGVKAGNQTRKQERKKSQII